MTFTKTGLSRAFLFLATGSLLLSAAPLMAAAPTHKGTPPAAAKSAPAAPAKVAPAPAAPAKVTPAPAPVRTAGQPASSATQGPSVTARKGRGSF